jgi:hypothetical protein
MPPAGGLDLPASAETVQDELGRKGPSDVEILARFVVDGRLKTIPAAEKKRTIVLKWLATLFEPGRTYHEKEVSETLRGVHEDFASLRRYLVDYGLMTRAIGIYQLADPKEES